MLITELMRGSGEKLIFFRKVEKNKDLVLNLNKKSYH